MNYKGDFEQNEGRHHTSEERRPSGIAKLHIVTHHVPNLLTSLQIECDMERFFITKPIVINFSADDEAPTLVPVDTTEICEPNIQTSHIRRFCFSPLSEVQPMRGQRRPQRS